MIFAAVLVLLLVIGVALHDHFRKPKPIVAMTPAWCRKSYNACLRNSTYVGQLLKQAGVPSQKVTVLHRRGSSDKKVVTVWPLKQPDYFTDGDGSGILYRRDVFKGVSYIAPLYMGMVNGIKEFELIDAALHDTPAMYGVELRPLSVA